MTLALPQVATTLCLAVPAETNFGHLERAPISPATKAYDYLVSTGNYGKIHGHTGDDIGILIGAHNVMDLGKGNDHGKVFGNKNIVYLRDGNDELEVASHQSSIMANAGDDSLYMHKNSSDNKIDAGSGDDLLYLGGTENKVTGGTGADIFIVGNDNIFSTIITDKDDYIAFDLDSYQDTMYYKSNNNLLIKHRSLIKPNKADSDYLKRQHRR